MKRKKKLRVHGDAILLPRVRRRRRYRGRRHTDTVNLFCLMHTCWVGLGVSNRAIKHGLRDNGRQLLYF